MTASGVWRIHALDQPLAGGLHSLVVPKDAEKNYWIEFRQDIDNLADGAVLNWGRNRNWDMDLLDMAPETAGIGDCALTVGRTFSDTLAGVHITPLGKGQTAPESLDVAVQIGAFSGNRAPLVAASADRAIAAPNTPVNFTAGAVDPDGDAVACFWDEGGTNFSANSAATSVTIPVAVAPGTCYLGAIADSGGAVAEANEANNAKASASLVLRPDLVLVSVTAAAAGRTVTFTDTVRNIGALPTRTAVLVDLRLTPDTGVGNSDPLVAQRTIPAGLRPSLAANAVSTATTAAAVPAAVAAGNYYGAAWADQADLVAELSEGNNKKVTAAKIYVGP